MRLRRLKYLIIYLGLILISNSCIAGLNKTVVDKNIQPLRLEQRGAWVRPPSDEKEIAKILDDLTTARFNMAFVETFYHGFTIYPSDVFPQRPEFKGKDILQLFITEAKKRNIEVHAWLEVLYWRPTPDTNFPQTPILNNHPDWLDLSMFETTTDGFEGKHYLVNPAVPGVRQKINGLVSELCRKYQIDGINLDYIRYAAGNTQFGYNQYALNKFISIYGYNPQSINPQKDTAKWMEWSKFREQQVTELVQQISDEIKRTKKPVKLSAAVFPDYYKNRYQDSRLQDWAIWCEKGYLDFLTPMCYSYSLEGIKDEIGISKANAAKVSVYPGLTVLAGTQHPELAQQIQVTRDAGCTGQVVFCYSWLTAFPNIFQDLGTGIYAK